MIKQVTVARALKEKNRLSGRLAQARNLIARENSHEKKVPRGVDVRAICEEAEQLKRKLVAIKAAIAVANKDIVAKIIELEETKSEITWLNGLDTKEGVYEQNCYRERTVEEYASEIKQAEALERMKALQKHADALQDELDEFNATARIEIEIED